MTSTERKQLLTRVKGLLEGAFGERLRGVILYGSEARGESLDDSDVDLLVLLTGPVQLWDDTRAIVETLYDLQLELTRPIHAVPADVEAYEEGRFALFRAAAAEGMRA